MAKDGNNRKQLDQPGELASIGQTLVPPGPQWHPVSPSPPLADHRRPSQIYLLNIAIGAPEKLTNHLNGAFDPAFSPDGSAVAYIGRSGDSGELCGPRPDGTHQIHTDRLPTSARRPGRRTASRWRCWRRRTGLSRSSSWRPLTDTGFDIGEPRAADPRRRRRLDVRADLGAMTDALTGPIWAAGLAAGAGGGRSAATRRTPFLVGTVVGILAPLRALGERVVRLALGAPQATSIWLGPAVYLALVTLFLGLISTPLSYYGGFVLNHRYGLSTQSIGGWLADWLKGTIIMLVLTTAAATLFYATVWAVPSSWWLVFWLEAMAAIVVLTFMAPYVFVPLFFKPQPVDDPGMVMMIEDLVRQAGQRWPGCQPPRLQPPHPGGERRRDRVREVAAGGAGRHAAGDVHAVRDQVGGGRTKLRASRPPRRVQADGGPGGRDAGRAGAGRRRRRPAARGRSAPRRSPSAATRC